MAHLLPYFCHFSCEKDVLSESKVIKVDANQLSTLHFEYQPMLLVFAGADWCSVAFFLTSVPIRVRFEILYLSLLKSFFDLKILFGTIHILSNQDFGLLDPIQPNCNQTSTL